MLKLKLQYFGHLMRRVDSLEKTLMLGGIGGSRRRGRPRMIWLDGITDSMDVSLSELRRWWWTGRPGMLRFMGLQTVGHDWATELNWTQTYCMILIMGKEKNRKPHGIKNRLMVSRAQGGRKGGVIANKYELFIELMKKSWKQIVWWLNNLENILKTKELYLLKWWILWFRHYISIWKKIQPKCSNIPKWGVEGECFKNTEELEMMKGVFFLSVLKFPLWLEKEEIVSG